MDRPLTAPGKPLDPTPAQLCGSASSSSMAAALLECDLGASTEDLNAARRRSRSQSLKDCHVRFDAVLVPSSDETSIVPSWRGDRNAEVQLGFLQLFHRYEVNFTLEGPYHRLRPYLDGAGNKNAKVVAVQPQQDASKLDIKMEVFVATDKVLHERCFLFNEEDTKKNIILNISAKVLSKDKGTPLLKKGIHCIEHYQDEESEYGS